MAFFKGELTSRELYRQAHVRSNVFYFLNRTEGDLKLGSIPGYERYGLPFYTIHEFECERFFIYPRLFGYSTTQSQYMHVDVLEYRSARIQDLDKQNYAFGNEEDCLQAALQLKLRGIIVRPYKSFA